MNFKRLLNKISIITGAGNGIGKSVAELLATEGSCVVISDIDLEKAKKVKEEIISNDIQIGKMVEAVLSKFGTVDILVNNAGILYPTKIEDITEKEWDMVMDINLKGTFLCSKAVIPVMKKNKWGRIINVSSTADKTVSTIGGVSYTASKSGALGLTRAMAKELAQYNII